MANGLFDNVYNPDVLSCLANLSNDEVFTPPDVVNQMLDMLPQELFSNPDTTFLDPACKTGVFLREIAKRLIVGLEPQFPDLQERLDHIFHHQLYGIAITELTSLLSRRGLYCSKYPNSEFSVSQFDDAQGNIRYKRIKHTWQGGKCIFCGATRSEYDRPDVLETYAYELLHPTKDGEEFFKMKFDVIIGNPPYQLSDGGGDGSSAQPIYQKFVQQAKKLNPQYLAMIIPARWYSGGKGLDEFRAEMLNDERLEVIHDFPETADCFPGINIRGGVCYFLWSKAHKGDCLIVNHKQNDSSEMRRPLLEKGADTFIRYNAAVSILSKVMAFREEMMDNRVSSRLPFGIPSNFTDYTLQPDAKHCVTLYRSERSKNADKKVYVAPIHITKNYEWKDSMKVLVSKASPGGDEYPHAIISAPVLAEINSVCTETYLIVDFVRNEAEGNNLMSYMRTRFFRFMMSLTRVPVFMYLTDYRERSLKDVITQLEPGLFKKVTGLDVKDFELLCSLGVFNANLMNDAIFKFKRYEDSSLSYTGIDKHEGKDIGGWDTVIKRAEYDQLFYNQQATMEAQTIFEVPAIEDIPVPAKKPVSTTPTRPTPVSTPAKPKPTTPLVTSQYGVKPAAPVTQAAKPAEFVAPDVKDGSVVIHKTFGEGTVTKLDKAQKHIRVTFAIGEKTFIFPDAFKMGFLKMKE